MNITMTNGHVLTTPLEVQNIESSVKNGFATIKNKSSFQTVEIVHGSTKFFSGCRIFLRGDSFVQPWAKTRYVVDGRELIMVPESEIIGVAHDWERMDPKKATEQWVEAISKVRESK